MTNKKNGSAELNGNSIIDQGFLTLINADLTGFSSRSEKSALISVEVMSGLNAFPVKVVTTKKIPDQFDRGFNRLNLLEAGAPWAGHPQAAVML